MTLWICWSIFTAALIAVAAAALDRTAALVDVPRRAVWMTAIAATIVAPLAFGVRAAPTRRRVRLAAAPALDTPSSAQPSVSLAARDGDLSPSGESSSASSAHMLSRHGWNAVVSRGAALASRADAWVLRAWLAASVLAAFLLAVAVLRLRSRRARWERADTEIGPVEVAPDVGPAVVGVLRPRIVLPRWAFSLESSARSLLLRHELEHVRAGDTRTLFASQLVLVAFPWNLPLRWMTRRLRLAIEMDCDARVLRRSSEAHRYASMLLAVGEHYASGSPIAASLLESRLELEVRVEAIAEQQQQRSRAKCVPLVGLAAIALVTVGWAPRPKSLLRQEPSPRLGTRMIERARLTSAPASRTSLPVVTTVSSASPAATAQPTMAPVDTPPAQPSPVSQPTSTSQPTDNILAVVGYVERKQLGRGFFVDGAMIDHDAQSFGDVLRVLPALGNAAPRRSDARFGLIIKQNALSSGRSYSIFTARDLSGCATMFLDGRHWDSNDAVDFDRAVKPSSLVAIEAYLPSEAPAQFATHDGETCATIIVWTREWTKRS